MDKHLDGAWDIFWIKSDNDTFTALQMKAFGPPNYINIPRVQKGHFAVFEKLPVFVYFILEYKNKW